MMDFSHQISFLQRKNPSGSLRTEGRWVDALLWLLALPISGLAGGALVWFSTSGVRWRLEDNFPEKHPWKTIWVVWLMVQKSGDHQLIWSISQYLQGFILYIPGAAGFLPSTVVSYFLTPRKLGKIPILTNIVQRAWNHQLANMELKHRVLFQMIFLFNPFQLCDLFGFHMNFPREAQFSVVPLEYSRRFFVDSKVFSNTAKLWECRALGNRPWEIYSTWNTEANTALMFEMKFLFQFFLGVLC